MTYSNLLVLRDSLFILIIIDRGLEDLDVMVGDISQNLDQKKRVNKSN